MYLDRFDLVSEKSIHHKCIYVQFIACLSSFDFKSRSTQQKQHIVTLKNHQPIQYTFKIIHCSKLLNNNYEIQFASCH